MRKVHIFFNHYLSFFTSKNFYLYCKHSKPAILIFWDGSNHLFFSVFRNWTINIIMNSSLIGKQKVFFAGVHNKHFSTCEKSIFFSTIIYPFSHPKIFIFIAAVLFGRVLGGIKKFFAGNVISFAVKYDH